MRRVHHWQNYLLLAASYFFYGYWDWRFLLLLWFTTGVDYFIARLLDSISDGHLRRQTLLVSILINLGVLGFFKYFNFFIGSTSRLLVALGVPVGLPVLSVVLPLGISFYTFQSLGYVIDVYRHKISASKNLVEYSLFVAFFPQLVAGPIERAGDLIPQIQSPRVINFEQWRRGIAIFIWGVWLKTYVADGLAPLVESVFQLNGGPSTATATWIGVGGFVFQVYADFFGYSLMARGLANLLGFKLSTNFDFPLFSRNISQFWRRWHITLSNWFREYVYFPLGGSRRGHRRTATNLIITMVLVGFWHGPHWTYIVWGLINGLGLTVHRWWQSKIPSAQSRLGQYISSLISASLTALFFALSLIIFRAESFTLAAKIFSQLWHGPWYIASQDAAHLLIATSRIVPVLVIDGWLKLKNQIDGYADWAWWVRPIAAATAVYLILFYGRQSSNFFYFIF